MYCSVSCTIAFVFLVSNLYMILRQDKTLDNKLLKTLDENQRQVYKNIVKERLDIYLKGFAIGLVLALLIIIINYQMSLKTRLSRATLLCFVLAVSFLFQYFYYILAPKRTYMLLHLTNEEQKVEWLKVYRAMQVKCHTGFVFGLIFVGFLCYGL